MRRPLLVLFVLLILTSFINTKNQSLYINEEITKINGVITLKKEKEKYDEYIIDNYIIKDYSKKFDLSVGSIVAINGKIKNLEDLKFDDFNYGRFIKSSGYKGLIEASSYEILGVNKFYMTINKIYTYIKDTTRYLYKENSDFINSLLLGMKYDLSDDETDMFSKTGTSHIIAMSGLHIGILSSIFILIMNKINKIYKLIFFSIIMFLYLIMVGSTPSLIRAILSMILSLFSYFIDRKSDSISNLSFIGIILLIINPFIIYNISFQLSFLATLSIIYFYKIINNRLNNSFLSITLSANILTFPLVYYYFNNISIISFLGNIVIVPFIGIIIYISIFSVTLFNINIFICKFLVSINRFIIDTIYFLLDKLSNINFLYFEFEKSNLNYVIIYYILIFSYMIYKEQKTIKEGANGVQGYYKGYKVKKL